MGKNLEEIKFAIALNSLEKEGSINKKIKRGGREQQSWTKTYYAVSYD